MDFHINTQEIFLKVEWPTETISQYVSMDKITNFCSTNYNNIVTLYDANLPITSPKNMAFLLVAPAASVAAASLAARVVPGAVALGAKSISVLANVMQQMSKVVDETMDEVGNKLGEFTNRGFGPEIFAATGLTAISLAGIGLSILATPLKPAPQPYFKIPFFS